MIKAIVFDLDGTLVQTEKLKAQSYAQAIVEIDESANADGVEDAFKEVVGASRKEVATFLVDRFGLTERLRELLPRAEPWETLVNVRMRHYHALLEDPEIILTHRWPHTLDLLDAARDADCSTAVATMSYRRQVARVLSILGLEQAFDVVATRDDVTRPKPDPEIYHLVAQGLGVKPSECIVVEDSLNGVRAGIAAGTHVIASMTPFTRDSVLKSQLLPNDRVVDDPYELLPIVASVLYREGAHFLDM